RDQVATATKITANQRPMTNAQAILISRLCIALILPLRLLTPTLPLRPSMFGEALGVTRTSPTGNFVFSKETTRVTMCQVFFSAGIWQPIRLAEMPQPLLVGILKHKADFFA
ncbi:MAG: hypothetical protein WBO29_01400, partial [Albidovulum sp.]